MAELSALEQAREVIKQQQAQLEELTLGGFQMGILRDVFEKSYVLQLGQELLEMDRKPGKFKYQEGDVVCVVQMTKQIMRGSEHKILGPAGKVVDIQDGLYEINIDSGNQSTIFISKTKVVDVEIGDRVLLDSSASIIVQKLKSEGARFLFTDQVHTCWDDIGGLETAKEELKMALEMPLLHTAIFDAFHKKPPKGFLFHGRPGNGKTMLGKAVTSSLAKHHGKNAATGFIYVKGPEILSKWVGETEATIRSIFAQAAAHKQKQGYPAVVFIDEADAILGNRTRNTSSSIGHTVVPQFLSEMDGMHENCAIVLLATNRADVLDPAVVRPGRIDRKIYVPAPTQETAEEIVAIHMKELPVSESAAELKQKVVAQIYSDDYPVYNLETSAGKKSFNLRELVSGAMLASVVEQAAAHAIQRNIKMDKKKSVDGLRAEDFTQAIASIHCQQAGMDHSLELKEFAENNKIKVLNTKPALQAA